MTNNPILSNNNSPFEIFNFTGKDIRFKHINKESFACAKDVCKVLNIYWGSKTLSKVPTEWQMVVKLPTISGDKNTIFLNQKGVMKLAFRSNKEEADKFVNWACDILDKLSKGESVVLEKKNEKERKDSKSLKNSILPSSSVKTLCVFFNGDRIGITLFEDKPYYSISGIARNLGYEDVGVIRKRVWADAVLSDKIKAFKVPGDGGMQTSLLLPVSTLPYFLDLLSFSRKREKDEAYKALLSSYKKEACLCVLSSVHKFFLARDGEGDWREQKKFLIGEGRVEMGKGGEERENVERMEKQGERYEERGIGRKEDIKKAIGLNAEITKDKETRAEEEMKKLKEEMHSKLSALECKMENMGGTVAGLFASFKALLAHKEWRDAKGIDGKRLA